MESYNVIFLDLIELRYGKLILGSRCAFSRLLRTSKEHVKLSRPLIAGREFRLREPEKRRQWYFNLGIQDNTMVEVCDSAAFVSGLRVGYRVRKIAHKKAEVKTLKKSVTSQPKPTPMGFSQIISPLSP